MLTDSLFIKKVLILLTVVMFPIWPAGVSEAAKIVCFGDSITVGLGSRTGGYPPKLQYLLEKHGKAAGISYFLVEMAWWWQLTSVIVVTAVLWSLRLLWKKGQRRQALR